MNDEMDDRAKQYWSETVSLQPILNYKVLHCIFLVKIYNVRVVTRFKEFIYDAIHGACLGEFWISKE